jgi:hypothetical protein
MSTDNKIKRWYDIAKQTIKDDVSLSDKDREAKLFNLWIDYVDSCSLKSDPILYKQLNNKIQKHLSIK